MWPQVTWVLLLALTPWAGAGEVLQPSLARPAVAASFTATLGKPLAVGRRRHLVLVSPCSLLTGAGLRITIDGL